MWCRWRYGGEDPYYVYNGRDAAPSPNPERVEALKDAFALYAHEAEIKMAKGRL